MRQNFRSHMRGFSQLDDRLVLVPAVILVTAILLPILGAVFERAHQKTCIENNHKVGHAILLYVQDYDEQFPIGRLVTANRGHSLAAGVGWAGGIYPYLKNFEALHCPDDPASMIPATGTVPALYPISYSYNRNLVDDRSRQSARLSSMTDPAATVLLAEVKGNLANVASPSELPSTSDAVYSSTGDGVNYLYWNDKNENALATGVLQYDGGLPAEFHCNNAAHPPSGCKGFTATNEYAGRHKSGAIYCLTDGHARCVKSESVSAGRNASDSDKHQTVKDGIVYAGGTAGSGEYELTYSTK